MYNKKEIISIIIFSIFNIFISYFITYLFKINGIIIFNLITLFYGKITYEVLLFFIISIIEILIYRSIKKRKEI